MTQTILQLIYAYSMMNSLDPNLVAAVAKHESKFDVSAVGSHGEVGLFQLRPRYFSAECKGQSTDHIVSDSQNDKGLGPVKAEKQWFSFMEPEIPFVLRKKTKKVIKVTCGRDLFDPETNIATAARHLARLQKDCKHKGFGAFVICHNVGLAGGDKIQKPEEFPYFKKVMAEYKGIKEANLFAQFGYEHGPVAYNP